MFKLDITNVVEYLKRHELIPSYATAEAKSLGGGISNRVIKVVWNEECVVVKQPLSKLNVEDNWPADLTRVHNEAAALRTNNEIITETGLSNIRVPRVVFEQRTDHVIGMECVPERNTVLWKRELLDGHVDESIAQSLGHALGTMQLVAMKKESLRDKFSNKKPFDQLRLDPYHRTTATRHPDVSDLILAEAERTRSVSHTLVHGDYSPKSVMVDRSKEKPEIWILDYEVAHWGDPAFDPAFMLNHLFIKSVYNNRRREEYIGAALRFWDAYEKSVEWDIEHETVTELGVLMLARIDGKSPVEYIKKSSVADVLRRTAKRTLTDDVREIREFATIAREESDTL